MCVYIAIVKQKKTTKRHWKNKHNQNAWKICVFCFVLFCLTILLFCYFWNDFQFHSFIAITTTTTTTPKHTHSHTLQTCVSYSIFVFQLYLFFSLFLYCIEKSCRIFSLRYCYCVTRVLFHYQTLIKFNSYNYGSSKKKKLKK